jgi:gas vesicle protein
VYWFRFNKKISKDFLIRVNELSKAVDEVIDKWKSSNQTNNQKLVSIATLLIAPIQDTRLTAPL